MSGDPVRARRAQFAVAATTLQRAGWLLIALATIAFVAGILTGFEVWGPVVIGALGLTAVTLAPGIVLGYAVKKAEREDPVRPPE